MLNRFAVFGFLLLAACAGDHAPIAPMAAADADWSRASAIEISLQDFDFHPAHLDLQRGRPYRLHLTNAGTGGHNFDTPEFFRTAAFRDDPASQKVRAAGGVIELAKGEAIDVYVVPTRAGSYAVRCSHPFHTTLGMSGDIAVN